MGSDGSGRLFQEAVAVIQVPQGFVVAEECRMACWKNGYRRPLGEQQGWVAFGSTTAKGTVYLAAGGAHGPWYLALDHPGVVAELGMQEIEMPGPGLARFGFDDLGKLYAVLARVYELGASLPDAPLDVFLAETKDLPKATEAERLVVQRVGQDIFRDSLLTYWRGRCPLTGIANTTLLRASHIKPWKDCDTDAERLDVYNGLLLSALWDAAFDGGLVTFEDDGKPRFAQALGNEARALLLWQAPLPLTDRHRAYLAWHRSREFEREAGSSLG
jgi:hypothetical protein